MTPEEARRIEALNAGKIGIDRIENTICDLAGQIADMTYEYAVQYKTPDGWEYTYESWDIRWQDSEDVQRVRAYRDHPGEETRIVRRLVSEPEVMEP